MVPRENGWLIAAASVMYFLPGSGGSAPRRTHQPPPNVQRLRNKKTRTGEAKEAREADELAVGVAPRAQAQLLPVLLVEAGRVRVALRLDGRGELRVQRLAAWGDGLERRKGKASAAEREQALALCAARPTLKLWREGEGRKSILERQLLRSDGGVVQRVERVIFCRLLEFCGG
jgi:hypothetical protein